MRRTNLPRALVLTALVSLAVLIIGIFIFSMFIGVFIAIALMVPFIGLWVKRRYPGGFHAHIVIGRSDSVPKRCGKPQAIPGLESDIEASNKQVRPSITKGNS